MIQHTDCRFPDDLDPMVKPTGEVEFGCMFFQLILASIDLTGGDSGARLEIQILSELPFHIHTTYLYDKSAQLQSPPRLG